MNWYDNQGAGLSGQHWPVGQQFANNYGSTMGEVERRKKEEQERRREARRAAARKAGYRPSRPA